MCCKSSYCKIVTSVYQYSYLLRLRHTKFTEDLRPFLYVFGSACRSYQHWFYFGGTVELTTLNDFDNASFFLGKEKILLHALLK